MQPAQDSPIIMLTLKKSPSKNPLLDFVKFEYYIEFQCGKDAKNYETLRSVSKVLANFAFFD